MKSPVYLSLRLARAKLHLPAALLIALLQRTPVVRVLAVADELVASSPLGLLLKSAVAAAASLGAVHSLAGATVLASSQSSPVTAKAGTAAAQVAFTVTNTINIASWRIGGTLPPGMTIAATENSSVALTGPGMLDATGGGVDDGYGGTTGGIASTTPVLSGTPTATGNYTFTLQAYEFAGLTGLASNTFSFTVNVTAADTTPPPATAPSFTTQPQAAAALAGGTVTLTATASGTPAPSYQWSKDGVAITGATSATLVLTAAQATDAGSYTVTATNSAGHVVSTAAVVTISPVGTQPVAPSIVQAPLSPTVVAGATVALNVIAGGTPAPTYQWRKDGLVIFGANKPSLILTGVTAADAGDYTVVASNSAGTSTSSAGRLALTATTNFGHLINLAILASLTTDVPDFTVATAIGGGSGGTKPMLVRVVGPTLGLAPFSIPGVVADPKLDLYAGSTLIDSNDNWGGDASVAASFASVGAFAYAGATTKDSALFLPAVAPGPYSVKVSGAGGGTGLVLAELYDSTPAGAFTAATQRFLNVSVLKKIAVGETLTVGFNVGGASARTVLIRAVGPTLSAAPFNIPGTMGDPQVQLYSAQTVLAANDDWGGDATVNSASNSVGAFALGDAASKDAVLVATLAPGSYTAVVSGANHTAGLTLVEVYDVP
jgi:hypothetical protein